MSDTIESADASVEIDVIRAKDLDPEEHEVLQPGPGEFCLFLMNGAAHQYVIVGDLAVFHARLTEALQAAGALPKGLA